jgi:hypothetical protein
MKRLLPVLSVGLLFACSTTHSAVGDASNARAEFEWMTVLVGDWSGTMVHEGQTVPFDTSFRLTGNGTVLQETLMKGTENEMISMYHLAGGELMHTHYCAMGNQPRMVARPSETKGSIAFEFRDVTNLTDAKAPHMHEMRLKIVDKDHLEEWWTAWKDGESDHTAHFVLTRKKPGV